MFAFAFMESTLFCTRTYIIYSFFKTFKFVFLYENVDVILIIFQKRLEYTYLCMHVVCNIQ